MAPWLHFLAFAHIFRLYLFFTVTCCYLLLFTCLIYFQADEFAKGLLALGLEPGVSSMAVIASPTIYSGVAMFVAANSIGVQFAVSITSFFLFCCFIEHVVQFANIYQHKIYKCFFV